MIVQAMNLMISGDRSKYDIKTRRVYSLVIPLKFAEFGGRFFLLLSESSELDFCTTERRALAHEGCLITSFTNLESA